MSKEVTDITIRNIEDAFKGVPISPKDAKPAMLRQMVWDGFHDDEVEIVINALDMSPADAEVYKKELQDSHRRIQELAPIQPLISEAINNMALAHTAAALVGGQTMDGGEVPDFVKGHIYDFHRRIIFSAVISTLSTLNHLGYIDMKAQNGK